MNKENSITTASSSAFSYEITQEQKWIHILPLGTFFGEDGRGPYTIENAQSIIDASKRDVVELSIDRDHKRFYSPPGTEVVAAGWIKEMEVREDGIYARVEWTPNAQKQISDKEYRYISPEFIHEKESGRVIRVTGATLTNTPNLELKAVASKQKDNQSQKQENFMETIEKLKLALGLDASITEDQLVEACQSQADSLKTLQDQDKALRKELSIDDKACIAAAVAAAQAHKAQEAAFDISKFVPLEVHKETASQLKNLQEQMVSEKAQQAVEAAMAAGKVTPASKDWALEYASKDPAGFDKYVASAPEIASAQSAVQKAAAESKPELTDVQKSVCRQLNISEEDYRKSL